MTKLARVNFRQYYDLTYRARNAKLQSVYYVVDFLDWVKAGVAFNTRGCELSTRKIAMFAELYRVMEQCVDDGAEPLRKNYLKFNDAIGYFYEDIFMLYQDYLASEQMMIRQRGLKSAPTFRDLLILPSFKAVPWLTEVFETKTEQLGTYVSKHERTLANNIASPYLEQETLLYKSLAMMYDYGLHSDERSVLLEVTLWNETK